MFGFVFVWHANVVESERRGGHPAPMSDHLGKKAFIFLKKKNVIRTRV